MAAAAAPSSSSSTSSASHHHHHHDEDHDHPMSLDPHPEIKQVVVPMETKEEMKGLDAENLDDEITLISKDGKHIKVTKRQAFISTLVKTSCETDPDTKEVPIPGLVFPPVSFYFNYLLVFAMYIFQECWKKI